MTCVDVLVQGGSFNYMAPELLGLVDTDAQPRFMGER